MSDFYNQYKVAEKFVSINGEGKRAGQLAVFIRFTGCNLKCKYCDTMWANSKDTSFEAMTAKQILDYILDTKVKNVTLTGGEPLLQENISQLITMLLENNLRVEIETNGSVDILSIRKKCQEYITKNNIINNLTFTVDYKTSCSGMEEFMCMPNFANVDKQDTVKFVCGSVDDLKTAKQVIEKYKLTEKCSVYLSSAFGLISPADIVEFMKQENMNDVNLQLQMHTFIWDTKGKGV